MKELILVFSILVDNWELHHQIGEIFADEVFATTGHNYTVGNSAIALYPAAGGSDDWAVWAGAEVGYTFILPGGGYFGFDLPASQLKGVVTETWAGFRKLLEFAGTHTWTPVTTASPTTTGTTENLTT